jgi:signal transduction histidine kinase
MATVSTTKGRLRWLLVLGLVLVPGAVLSIVTWRLIGQERELEASRLAERRALAAARIAQQMLTRLDLERAAARATQDRGAFMPDSGVLVVVAPLTERGMALPWEPGPASERIGSSGDRAGAGNDPATRLTAPDDSDYRRHIAEGETLEFSRNRPDLAVRSYAAAAEVASTAASRIDARLREARALSRAGRTDAARTAYTAIAAASPQLRDRDGMPLALYGVEGLLRERNADVRPVVNALEDIIESTDLGPPALYAFRDLALRVATLADSTRSGAGTAPPTAAAGADELANDAPTLDRRIEGLERAVTERIRVVELVVELRRDLPAVLSLAGTAGADSARQLSPQMGAGAADDSGSVTTLPSAWRPWGRDAWLVGVQSDGDRRLVLVADPVRLLHAIAAEAPEDLGVALPAVSLSTLPGPEAELLGPSFPALFAVLPDAAIQAAESSGFGRVLLMLVLPLVLAVTAVAAFLLWRDVRREIETAGVRAQFVSSVSHELKTPLTSIRMYAQTLLMGRHRAETDRRTYLETIVNESERLTRLINNVLDFSRIERGGRNYHMEPVPLASVVNDAARAMSYPLEQGGFELHVQVAEGIPDIRCDGDALTQAVVNLLSNAVKFSGSAKSIELELARDGDSAVIRVRDHGHGIDRRHHAAVFERFFRTPEAESKGLPGTGLGLALVAHVAHAHGGTVDLDSAPGHGSTFTIRLPLDARTQRADTLHRNLARTEPDPSSNSKSKPKSKPSERDRPTLSDHGTRTAGVADDPEHVSP